MTRRPAFTRAFNITAGVVRGRRASDRDRRAHIPFRQGGKVGEDLRVRRTFGKTQENRLQGDARFHEDRLAANDLRIANDPFLVAHANAILALAMSLPKGEPASNPRR